MDDRSPETLSLRRFLSRFTEQGVANLADSREFAAPESVTYTLVNYLAHELCFGESVGLAVTVADSDVAVVEAWIFASFLYYRHACNRSYRRMCGFPLDGTEEHKTRDRAFDAAIAVGVSHVRQLTGHDIASHWRDRFMEYIGIEKQRRSPQAATEHFVFLFYAARKASSPEGKYVVNIDWVRRGIRHLGGDDQAVASELFGPTIFVLNRPEACLEMYVRACAHYGWNDG